MHMCVLIPESAVTECNRLIKRHLFLIVLEPPGLQNLPCSKLIVFKLNVWKCENQRAHIEMGSTLFLTLNNVMYFFFITRNTQNFIYILFIRLLFSLIPFLQVHSHISPLHNPSTLPQFLFRKGWASRGNQPHIAS